MKKTLITVLVATALGSIVAVASADLHHGPTRPEARATEREMFIPDSFDIETVPPQQN